MKSGLKKRVIGIGLPLQFKFFIGKGKGGELFFKS
jgi:hypothetical protein